MTQLKQPDAIMVVYCAAESHADSRVEWRLVRGAGIWHDQTRAPRASRTNDQPRVITVLASDRVLDEFPGVEPTRHHYEFRCGRCGNAYCGKGIKVDAVLDRLVVAGRGEISIDGLRSACD